MAQTPAERARAYRARARAKGASTARGARGKRGKPKPSLFDRGRFVAIDGEGFSEGDERTWHIGPHEIEYRGRPHNYAFLSASDGAELYAVAGRLGTGDCLDFLLDVRQRDPDAILVCFGGSYDFCHMLHDLDRDDVETLLRGDGRPFSHKYLDVTIGAYDYRLECRMRKSLSVWRWPAGADKYRRVETRDGTRKWKLSPCDRVTLWDVWGFFQGSFRGAMDKWLNADPDYDFIVKMKGERSIFTRDEIDLIRRYNAAELRCLVAMMDRVRDAIRGMGLTISRWDGAGAIAGAMMKVHDVKAHMAPSPPDVFEAARHAYSGGHIEMIRMGHHQGTIYHNDINSAYPDQFRRLPSLTGGTWRAGTGTPPDGFTLVRVAYSFARNLPFYPLFYRESNGTILYPRQGEGWHWFPEYDAARIFFERFGGDAFQVIAWHHYETTQNASPFSWIEDYFARRKELVEESKRTGIPNGEEKTLKLGYNSCYGKTAQQVGARWQDGEIVPPTYFQLEWAGYVTAGCRAKLMLAAMEKPHAIISFATDALFSLEPLNLYAPAEKILGAWEAQQHDGMTLVMPGVYWLHDGEKTTHYSRGFNKKDMEGAGVVLRAWARRESHFPVEVDRMITLGSALISDDFWNMRGMFIKMTRSLAINGDNSKRYPIALSSVKPHKSMVITHPRELWDGWLDIEDAELSAIYPISWLDIDLSDETGELMETSDQLLETDMFAAFYA